MPTTLARRLLCWQAFPCGAAATQCSAVRAAVALPQVLVLVRALDSADSATRLLLVATRFLLSRRRPEMGDSSMTG